MTPRDPLAALLAKAHYELVAPILTEEEYAAMSQYLREAGVTLDATRPSGDEALRAAAGRLRLSFNAAFSAGSARADESCYMTTERIVALNDVGEFLFALATRPSGDEALRAALARAEAIDTLDYYEDSGSDAFNYDRYREDVVRAALAAPVSPEDPT